MDENTANAHLFFRFLYMYPVSMTALLFRCFEEKIRRAEDDQNKKESY